MNEVTSTEQEANIIFGYAYMAFCIWIWIWRLRIPFPYEETLPASVDISSCFVSHESLLIWFAHLIS